MNAFEREQLITEANQKEIRERMDNQRQTQLDMVEGTKNLAVQREKDLQALEDNRNQYKEVAPVPEAVELQQLQERAKLEDAQEELQALRKRFAKGNE
ncbi:hypothetical protein [Planococcus donghaensis]|uniref:hypothetical protein n=1 Tax=Planococcus donghaensis TaxID=414778 RepID=UPI0037359257